MDAKQRLTVLVVDDEALLRWSLAELLRRGGHAVIEAASAADARDAMNGAPDRIDVVLLDYRLGDSNDLRLLEEVRHRVPRSAVVLMTAFDTPEMVRGATERGAYCVLNKPFDMYDVEPLVTEAHRASQRHPGCDGGRHGRYPLRTTRGSPCHIRAGHRTSHRRAQGSGLRRSDDD